MSQDESNTTDFASGNVYRPTDSGMAGGDEGGPSGNSFGSFDFGSALNAGFDGFKRNWGAGAGLGILLILVVVVAAVTCVGVPLAIPHLMAAFPMMGLAMVRREVRAGDVFVGFSAYGTILVMALITFFIGSLVNSIFSGPLYYHYMQIVKDSGALSGNPQAMQEMLKRFDDPALGMPKLLSYIGMLPAQYLAARWLLAVPLVIERRHGAVEALKVSWSVTAPFQLMLFLYMILAQVILAAGAIVCGVGILFTFPLAMALHGAAIRQLFGEGAARS